MSLEYSYKDIEWCNFLFCKSDDCYCDGNIIIPDSMDDVAKVVSVKAYPSVTDVKCENGKISVSGQVKLNVLYVGENESNKICTLNTSQMFSHIITDTALTEDLIPIVTVSSCNASYSAVNSRRLKITVILRFSAECCKTNRMKILSSAQGAEAKCEEHSFCCARVVCRKNAVVNDTVELPAGKGVITSLLKQSVRITDKDFKVLNNKLIVKGNLAVTVLYMSGGSITDTCVTLPFTEVIEADGLSPSQQTSLDLSVSDWDIKPDTDLSGECKMLDVSVVLSAVIKSFVTNSVCTVSDIYLPGGAIRTQKSNITLDTHTESLQEEEFIKESITLPNLSDTIHKVIDTDCRISDLALSDNSVSANAEITLMYLTSDSPTSVSTASARVPVMHKFAHENVSDPRLEINNISYAITDTNTLEVRFTARFKAQTAQSESFNILTECIEEEYHPQKRASVIVSVVNKGDTLWDIAKKHNIALSNLASANALDENAVLTVGEKLIIPR